MAAKSIRKTFNVLISVKHHVRQHFIVSIGIIFVIYIILLWIVHILT